jgi:hypothetical protein
MPQQITIITINSEAYSDIISQERCFMESLSPLVDGQEVTLIYGPYKIKATVKRSEVAGGATYFICERKI